MSTNVVAQAACDYITAGFAPIPVLPRSKNPGRDDWPNLQVTPENASELFLPDGNIGLKLGKNGNNRIDADADCREAIALASAFLPATDFVHGRTGAPRSHRWFTTDAVPEHRKFEFAGETLVELRTVGQTIVPPSIHPTGEQLTWDEATGEPAKVSGAELSHAVAEWAAATLAARHYPKQGSRHEFSLALAGFLLRQSGWDAQRVCHFVCAVASVAGDDEIKDRETAVETTAERLATGGKALGGTRFRELVGNAVFDKFCEWMGFAKGTRAISLPVIESSPVADEALEDWPVAALEGDFISDLMHSLTDGTPIPPQFVREGIILCVGALSDQVLGYPRHPDLTVRRYTAVISERPQAGKGESWKRVGNHSEPDAAFRFFLETARIKGITGSGVGSGQFLAVKLEENPRAIVFWDEGSGLFQQTSQQGCTLLSALKSLFEGRSHWSGSITNKGQHGTDEASLSVLLHCTRKKFLEGFSTRGGMGDGLLSRFIFSYANAWPVCPEWALRDFAREGALTEKIVALIPNTPTAPGIDPAARERMVEFAHEVNGSERPHPDHSPRLLEHAKVDVLMRAVFSGSPTITLEMVERSIAWARHQLALRIAFWPPDAKDEISAMTQTLRRRLHKGAASTCDLRRYANVGRDGTDELFARALSALKRSGQLVILGTNRKGKEVFGLEIDDEEGEKV